jgi:polar amino acid transport system substrate-binding protein
MDGRFTAVQQAVGTAKANQAGARFLHDFVEDAKASGIIARLIEGHLIRGLSVVSPATLIPKTAQYRWSANLKFEH